MMDRPINDILESPQSVSELYEAVSAHPVSDADSRWQKQVLMRIMEMVFDVKIVASMEPPVNHFGNITNETYSAPPQSQPQPQPAFAKAGGDPGLIPDEGITTKDGGVQIVSPDDLSKEQREIINGAIAKNENEQGDGNVNSDNDSMGDSNPSGS